MGLSIEIGMPRSFRQALLLLLLLLLLAAASCMGPPSELMDDSTYSLVGEAPQKTSGAAPAPTETTVAKLLSQRIYQFGLQVQNFKKSQDTVATKLQNSTTAYTPDSGGTGGSTLGALTISGNHVQPVFLFEYAEGLEQINVSLDLPLDTAQAAVDELVARKFVVNKSIDSTAKCTGEIHVTGQDSQGNAFDLTYSEPFHAHREDFSSGR